MKRRLRYGLVIIILSSLFFFLVVKGGRIMRTFEVGECTITYDYFLTNNAYCNWITGGHCTDNFIQFNNARRKMGTCLCESTDSRVSREKLVQLVASDTLLKQEFLKLKAMSSEGDSVKLICDNKKTLFQLWYKD